MSTDQRPDGIPPFFFELDHQERLLLASASMFRCHVDELYRLRGAARTADGRETQVGRLDELNLWFASVQELGDRLSNEYASRLARPTRP